MLSNKIKVYVKLSPSPYKILLACVFSLCKVCRHVACLQFFVCLLVFQFVGVGFCFVLDEGLTM